MVDEDVEELREILSVVSSEVPKLLKALSESLFGPEQTASYAKAVSEFYKSLREAGMEEEQAFELTKEFMDRTNLAALVQEVLGGREGQGAEGSLETLIKERIREKLEDRGLEVEEE